MKKILLVLALMLVFVGRASAYYDFKQDGISYLKSGDNVSVSNEQSCSGDVVIPSSVIYGGKTYNVTSIVGGAFSKCYGVTSISIPNSISSIGSYTFEYCTKLASISLPSSVTSIGQHAFRYCGKLTSISIPNTVANIGDYAFQYCM